MVRTKLVMGAGMHRRRESVRHLRQLVRYARPGLVATTVVVHTAAGICPLLVLIGTGMALPALSEGRLAWQIGLALSGLALQQLLAPIQLVLSREISRQVDSACISRLTGFALRRARLSGLERPDVADRLAQADEAFEQWSLTPGSAVEGALALVARYTQLIGALVTLAVLAGPGAALAGAVVALVTRSGHSEAFHKWGNLIRGFAPLRRRASYVRELATGTRASKEIRSLGILRWLDERYRQENRTFLASLWKERRRVYGLPFITYALVALVGSAVALLIVGEVAPPTDGAVSVLGAVSMSVQAILLCSRFGVMFPESDVKLVYGRSAWRALLEFEAIADEAVERPGAAVRRAVEPREVISFDDVRFGYSPEKPVLDGLDLDLPVGSSTALIGVNGAGKTTLVKVLSGIYRPDSGRVAVDGTDLSEIDTAAWQSRFAVVFQDFLRYELTLRENVAMGSVSNLDDDEGIDAVLVRAGLGDLLDELPDGLETPLTRSLPGGRELSGGQWQRVAIARALFAVRHGARVLVLDEPTSQLDARGEAAFYDTFLELTRGVTTLVISHRFSSVRKADQIVVLDRGRVTEKGTHSELVRLGGTYSTMFEIQARKFGAVDPDLSTEAPEVMR